MTLHNRDFADVTEKLRPPTRDELVLAANAEPPTMFPSYQRKLRAAIAWMGTRYLCHPSNRLQRQAEA